MKLSDTKVGLLYPWEGLPCMDRGSARRVSPLISLLGRECKSVEVLSPGGTAPCVEGNVTFRYHRPGRVEEFLTRGGFWLFDGITYHLWNGSDPARERRQWWHYLKARLTPSLKDEIRKVSERNDVLLVEYPFWIPLLSSIPDIKPVILTFHDILSESVTQPWLKGKVVEEELAACRSASSVVCCNDSDAAFLNTHGFSPKVVPHGITIPKRGRCTPATPEGKLFEVIEERRRAGAMICFFVGSSHQPNREALDAISLMARELHGDSRFLFVSAGSCCAPSLPSQNEVHLGAVTEETLDWLYSRSEIILAPLKRGTGASLKTIEALARKKVLLTTMVGARGYPLVSGRDALIIDQPKDFTRALLHLADQPEEIARLSAGGWEFAQQYDSDHVYKAYLPTISDLIDSKRP